MLADENGITPSDRLVTSITTGSLGMVLSVILMSFILMSDIYLLYTKIRHTNYRNDTQESR